MNNNIDNYIKKIIELQETQKKISDEDLASIAKELGFDLESINKFHQDCVKRGTSFLKFQNYEDAKYEFEQASTLKPNDVETLFGLASAYAGMYETLEKSQDKQKSIELATKCLQINPNYEPAAKLISFLKQDKKIMYQNNTKPSTKKERFYVLEMVIAFFALSVVGILIFLSLKSSPTSIPKSVMKSEELKSISAHQSNSYNFEKNMHSNILVNGVKGTVLWLIYYEQVSKNGTYVRSYYVDIVNVPEGKLRKRVLLAPEVELMQSPYREWIFMGNKLYTYLESAKEMLGYDIYSGEIVENKVILQNRFTELNEGIGTFQFYNHSKYWLKIVLRSGKEFRYSPYFDKLWTEEYAKLVDKDFKNKVDYQISTNWGVLMEQQEAQKNIIYYQEKLNPFYFYHYQKNLNKILDVQLKYRNYFDLKKSENKFLEPKLLFGNQNFALIYYLTEIGEEGKTILALIDAKTGKTKWEIKNTEQYMMFKNITKNSNGYQSLITQNNKIIIYNPYFVANAGKRSVFFACEIDADKGIVNWEYSPQNL